MKKILVIGDSCIDILTEVKEENRPELNFKVYKPINKHKSTPGMAGNVYENIKVMGEDVSLCTQDEIIMKWKIINKDIFRIDFEPKIKRIENKEMDYTYMYDIIVISDYDKGFLKKKDIKQICKHPFVIIDTKKPLGDWCLGAKYIKINQHEFNNIDIDILNKINDKLIVTTGPSGCTYNSKTYPVRYAKAEDVSGAGDTFLAGLVSSLSRGKNIDESIKYANKCARVAVKHKGTYILKENEV